MSERGQVKSSKPHYIGRCNDFLQLIILHIITLKFMTKHSSSAILVFSRTSDQEAQVKTFSSHIGKKGNKKIAQLFIKKAIKKARCTGLPVFISFGNTQVGNTFGEKLANAFEQIFLQGYENVIAIGNDCPNITREQLLKTNDLLNSNQVVLGPSKKGGLYLIGMNRDFFNKKKFQNFRWESSLLSSEWKIYCDEFQFASHWLDAFNDINGEKDFSDFFKSLNCLKEIRTTLKSILASRNIDYTYYQKSFFILFLSKSFPLRAPPLF